MSREDRSRRREEPPFYEINGDARGYKYGDPRGVPYMYENGGYMFQDAQMPATRYTGMFPPYPFYGYSNGHSKRSNDSDSDDFRQRNHRRCLCISVVVVATVIVLGAIATTLAVVLSSDTSEKQTGPITETIVVNKSIPGEATLKDREFTPELKDPNSQLYKQTSRDFCDKVSNKMMQDQEMRDKYAGCTVIGFRSGSVVVIFNISMSLTVSQTVSTGSDGTTTQSAAVSEALQSVNLEVIMTVVASVDTVAVESVRVTETSACESNPCINNGTCIGAINYTCQCAAGWTGINCETDEDECGSNPCQNGGSCVDQVNGYNCECMQGYSGITCETNINECLSNPCNNFGTCVDGVNSYTCTCLAGYTGTQCDDDIDECSSDPCQNGGTCSHGVNTYTCACVPGYKGDNCEINIEECQSSPCLNGATCTDGVNSYTCSCASGYTGTHCETDVDECESSPCMNSGSCKDEVNSYTCSCMAGFTGNDCETDINECLSNPCEHQGSCTDQVNDYSCSCVAGYTGKSCQNNIDECACNPCIHGGCFDRVNGYMCTCNPGYSGTSCEIEINECAGSPCLHGGVCTDNVNGYTCACVSGYTGKNCEENIDDCVTKPCLNNGQCMDKVNGFECACQPGYTGMICQLDINECNSNPCQNEGFCVDGVNSYTCQCKPGYTGIQCQTDINECACTPCQNGGSCSDNVNGYTCTCADGFTGTNCETDINECVSTPCQNGGSCSDNVNGYTCTCDDGFTGTNCETDIDDCTSAPCQNSGSCTDKVNGYACNCVAGYTGQTCQTNINECASDPCQHGGSCIDGIGGYTCMCAGGYTGTKCEISISTSSTTSTTLTSPPSSSMTTPYSEPEPETESEGEAESSSEPETESESEPSGTTTSWQSQPWTTPSTTQLTNCSAGYELVEMWAILPYRYSSYLQNRTSVHYDGNASFVNSLMTLLNNTISPGAIHQTEIVIFQPINGTANTSVTVRACVMPYFANTTYLYYDIAPLMELYNVDFLGARVLSYPEPVSSTNFTCYRFYYTCTNKIKCIPYGLFCNGFIDCMNGEDESNALCGRNTTTTPPSSTTGTCRGFTCDNGICINILWVCNGDNDCGDFSDERFCNATTPRYSTTMSSSTPCQSDMFTCYDLRRCISKNLLCDGNYDCEDRSDEWQRFCPSTPEPRPLAVEIRLVDGSIDTTSQLYGRVEVRPAGSNGSFGTVCDDMWGVEEAETVCRQLGYSNGNVNVYGYPGAWFGMGTGPIYLTNMRCNGSESNLMECESTGGWNDAFCGHNQDASVSCGMQFTTTTQVSPTIETSNTTTVSPPTAKNIKLIGGDSCLSGIIMVTLNGRTGTVCDDSFGQAEANVACRMLGLDTPAVRYGNFMKFTGPVTTPILLDDLYCRGTEDSLFDCGYTSRHNCYHSEDVAIICPGQCGTEKSSVNCTFERGNCSYTQETLTGDIQWKRGNPFEFRNDDYLMYTYGNQGSARLISPAFNGSTMNQSVGFMYKIINSHSQNLRLVINKTVLQPHSEVLYPVWNSSYLRSDEDSKWIYHCVNIPTSSSAQFQLMFEGTVVSGTNIGLADINVQPKLCNMSLVDGICTFDRPVECGLTIECSSCTRDSHPYRWYWTGQMLHADSSFGEAGDTANVWFKLPYIRPNWYLRARVNMSGVDSHKMRVFFNINNTEFKTMYTHYGNQGLSWATLCIKLPDLTLGDPYELNVGLESTRGQGPFADIFLDDVEVLTDQACEEQGMPDGIWTKSNHSSNFLWQFEGKGSQSGSLRLVNGSSPTNGLLQIRYNGVWRHICDWGFGYSDLRVACRELGFSNYRYYSSRSVTNSVGFWVKNLRCLGNESTIFECDSDPYGSTSGCRIYDHVFAYCSSTQESSTYFTRNFFSIKDSNTEFGISANLTSKAIKSETASIPWKFSFKMHKMTEDQLKVWFLEDDFSIPSDLLKITDTSENETVCVNFMPSLGHFNVGITAIKSGTSKAVIEVQDLQISQGSCHNYIGMERCDFQSQYAGCRYTVDAVEIECNIPYKWMRVPASGKTLDYTLQNSFGRFLYIDDTFGEMGASSSVVFDSLELSRVNVSYVCSLRFAYFAVGQGTLAVDVNGRQEQVSSLSFVPYMWRQGCLMINPDDSCPLQSGTVNVSIVASGVRAGIDDVFISAEPCSARSVSCEFDQGDSCGYSWIGNLTVQQGKIVNNGESNNFTMASPVFTTSQTENCIVLESSTVRYYYNLSVTVYNLQGTIINSTTISEGSMLILDILTTPGTEYVLFIDGRNRYSWSYRTTTTIESVHLHSQSCSSVVLPCNNFEIECGDGTCTSSYNICDGKRDCSNGMDEQMCDCLPYYFNRFNCSTSGCIYADLRCDGTPDCADGSDEICDESLTCSFNDSYNCGYTFYKFYLFGTDTISNGYLFGYIESPVINITTESCYSIKYNYQYNSFYTNHTSIRFIANTSNSLSELLNIDVMTRHISMQGYAMGTLNVMLPVGTYSIITEAQGVYLSIFNASFSASPCLRRTSSSTTDRITSPSSQTNTSVNSLMSLSTSTNTPPTKDLSTNTAASSANQSTQMPKYTNTSSTTMQTSTISSMYPDGFPVVSVTSHVYGAIGEYVELGCVVTGSPTYETILYWLDVDDKVVSRGGDIMVDEDMASKYSLSIGGTPDNQEYNLTVRIDPKDSGKTFSCVVDVVGHPDYTHLQMEVEILIPEPVMDGCSQNPLYTCKELGFEYYSLPAVIGLTNHSQMLRELLDIFYTDDSNTMTSACSTVLQELACGIYTPKCDDQGETVPVCRDHCEDVAGICQQKYPNLVLNNNEDLDYFCKFLPYQSAVTCTPVYLKCGSDIQTSSREFRLRSDHYPADSLCSYKISAPVSDYILFDWLEITIESLTLDPQCDQSNFTVGDTTLCSDAVSSLPKTILVQKSSVNIVLSVGNQESFTIAARYVPPSDLCDIYNITTYSPTVVEAAADTTCSRWIFVMKTYKDDIFYLKLDFESVNGGCVSIDEHTGAPTRAICSMESVDIMSENFTITTENATFKLNTSVVRKTENEGGSGGTENRVLERVELGLEDASNVGGVLVYRSDGRFGLVCYMYGEDSLCKLAGFSGVKSRKQVYRNWPDNFQPLAYRLYCYTSPTGEPYCNPSWLDDCSGCSCYSYTNLTCALPSVSCNFKDGIPCGYSIKAGDHATSLKSPVFKYEPGTSVTTTILTRGMDGDGGSMSLILENGTEVLLVNSLVNLNTIVGQFNVCVSLPDVHADMNVRLNYNITFVAPVSSENNFNLTMVNLEVEDCSAKFPETQCNFDDLLVCEPFISGTCSSEIWNIKHGELIGSALYGAPNIPYSTAVTLTDVSMSTTKYLHFMYKNNGSMYFGNSLNFSVIHKPGSQDAVKTELGPMQNSVEQCVRIDIVPNEVNTVEFELVSNSSQGYLIIDNIAVNDDECPHPASCNFESSCNITFDRNIDGFYWDIRYGFDHTYWGQYGGAYISQYYGYSIQGGSTASFSMARIPIDSQYQCLRFFYRVYRRYTYGLETRDSNTVFLNVHVNYTTTGNNDTTANNETKKFGVAEHREVPWKEALVPIDSDSSLWDFVGFSFVVTKIFDNDYLSVDVDDISLEKYPCKYGLQNMDVCTFDEPMKCLYTANCTEDSGYIWNLNWDEANRTNQYLHVLNSYGVEGDQSYIWFEVDLSSETENLFYQYSFKFKATGNSGRFYTFVESRGITSSRRKKREVEDNYQYQIEWQKSDCTSLSNSFAGRIYFVAVRGSANNGGVSLDNLEIKRGSCQDPSISCDFTQNDCGYIPDFGTWSQTENGISSQTERSGLLVPLQKLSGGGCLQFQGQSVNKMSEFEVHVATTEGLSVYKFGNQSGSLVSGRLDMPGTQSLKSVKFVLPANTGDVLTSVSLSAGSCSMPICLPDQFVCQEKCILQTQTCDKVQNCFSGIDEDFCGYSLGCTLENGDLCNYKDTSKDPVNWVAQNAFTYTDENGNQQTISPADNGLLSTQFTESTSFHAKLESIKVMVHSDSCFMFTYTGTVDKLYAHIKYDNGTVTEWMDKSVRTDRLDWKVGMINVSAGHVMAGFNTSMITRVNNLPSLLMNSFLLIDNIFFENKTCADVVGGPVCPMDTIQCSDGSLCYNLSLLCNQIIDCPDGSDEDLDTCASVFTLDCTFEEPDGCYYVNKDNTSINYMWKRQKAYRYELPNTDHTFGNFSGHFLIHTKLSDRPTSVYNATVESAIVKFDSESCVSFWYFMNSTKWQPNSLTAELFVSVVYQDGLGMTRNLLWYDSADRHFNSWVQGAVSLQANRFLRLEFMANTFVPVEMWPGLIAIDDIHTISGPCLISQVCKANNFECTSGACIPGYYRCDGDHDCPDGSDEMSCDKPDHEIEVVGGDGSYGQVRAFLNGTWRSVCLPFRDEARSDLARAVCRNQGFHGLSEPFAYSISSSSQRHVQLSCSQDGNCTAYESYSSYCSNYFGLRCSQDVCFAGERLCPGTKLECKPAVRFCDGLQDCTGNTDEINCTTCDPDTEFECFNHICIPLTSRCDGEAQCSDGSDEYRCYQLEHNGMVTAWDRQSESRKTLCYNDVNRTIAENLCRLSGNGLLALPGIGYYLEEIYDGVVVHESGDDIDGLEIVEWPSECYPLNLSCSIPECGTTMEMDNQVEALVIWGDEAVDGEWPWHCALFSSTGWYMCGASYIGDGYFLTAAHCVDDSYRAPFSLNCGTATIGDLGEYGAVHVIGRYMYPDEYDGNFNSKTNTNMNDIAILQARTLPLIDNYTRPVCLGSEEDFQYILSLGRTAQCYSIGFGYTETYKSQAAPSIRLLKEASANIMDFDYCNQVIEELGYRLYNDSICVQNSLPFEPFCYGDSGSSLICKDPRNGRWKQFGITSFGPPGCFKFEAPVVFNEVFKYFEWIKDKTGIDFADI